MKHQGYGLPLRCPKCSEGQYYGMLKVPGNKAIPCPNCKTPLIAIRRPVAVIYPEGDDHGVGK